MFEDFLQQKPDDLDKRSLRRRLCVSDAPTGPVVEYNGRKLHNFASNDYLGFAEHPEVVEAAVRAEVIKEFVNHLTLLRAKNSTAGPEWREGNMDAVTAIRALGEKKPST